MAAATKISEKENTSALYTVWSVCGCQEFAAASTNLLTAIGVNVGGKYPVKDIKDVWEKVPPSIKASKDVPQRRIDAVKGEVSIPNTAASGIVNGMYLDRRRTCQIFADLQVVGANVTFLDGNLWTVSK